MSKNKNTLDNIKDVVVTPTQLSASIKHAINIKQPFFIWGSPGIGKSEIVHSVCKSLNRPMIDIRLPLLEPTDIRGIPYLADVKLYDENGQMLKDDHGLPIFDKEFRWSTPSDLPTDKLSNAVVFFDELNSAVPQVQAATYQLILNRQIGNYKLPENVAIIAAGNRMRDGGVTHTMPTPLANRFSSHLTLKENIDDWISWATSVQIHKDVVGFIKSYPIALNTFDPNLDDVAFSTPRSLSFLSNILQYKNSNNEYEDFDIEPSVKKAMIKGCIGVDIGNKFIIYQETTSQLPPAKDIIEGRVKKVDFDISKIGIFYSLITSCAYYIKNIHDKHLVEKDSGVDETTLSTALASAVNNFYRFLMDNAPAEELIILGAQTIMTTYQIPVRNRQVACWPEFVEKYYKLI